MSGSIDEPLVSMKFDNAAFEKNVRDTLTSLDKLRASLDFANSTRNLDDLSSAGRNFNLSGISSAVEGVSGKFLSMVTVGVTALATITEKAVSAGLNFTKAFTFAPIMDGFHEFETNMDSIQTILANTKSKGSTLNDVNKSLDELNTYSDKTIYNFTQMAKNIGTFTAAGVDLKTSTASIKGIANLAAVSGSSAEQASTAMYQLSQAIASGSVKLMDWNSVVNAGMGGETFQKALFESGKAMKTLTNVPAGQTFEEWKKAGNSFRDSLQDGWITTEVLTKTLNGLSGDMTAAQLKAQGYTDAQAKSLYDLGQTGLTAATQVKTLTQLVGTVKEAVGSGWTKTFQILFGNFSESVQLFTSINNVISKMVGNSADARNSLLEGWKDLGGRTLLIKAFSEALQGIASIVKPIKEAFREVFPPTTAKQLYSLTKSFEHFAASIKIGTETAKEIKTIFLGLFSIFDIGWAIIKGVFSVFQDLFSSFSGSGSSTLSFLAKIGEYLVNLDASLVGLGKIQKFFDTLGEAVKKPVEFIKDLTDRFIAFFDIFGESGKSKAVEDSANRISSRFDALSKTSERLSDIWDRLGGLMDRIKKIFDTILSYLQTWFSQLGNNIAAAMQPGDFNSALDALNVGLLGGIAVMLKKFLNGGLNVDLGNGVFEKIGKSLDSLTGQLKAMQTQLKAKALLEIAGAIALLTVSIVALSLIDSAALTKSLTALTVGFADLLGVMKAMDSIASNSKDAAKLGIMAGALVLVAGAALILTAAIAVLAQLSWEDLAKGIAGIAAALAILIGAAQFMSTDASGMIAGGIAMSAMAVALTILGGAVKIFADMSVGEMAQGLIGVGVALGLIVVAMNAMPPGPLMVAAGVGMVAVATSLTILAGAVKLFGMMGVGEMVQGLIGIGAALLVIAGAMQLMPINLPITAAGLVILSVALTMMAGAVKLMGAQDLGSLAKGIGAFAAMLLILVVAVNAMNGAVTGATALVIVAGALLILSKVLTTLGSMDIKELALGLGAIAAVLVLLGVAALVMEPVIPALLGLAIALGLIGVAFALFGVGAFLTAKAFEALAAAGKAGIAALIDAFVMLIAALPKLVAALVESLFESASQFLTAGTLLIKIATVFLLQILDTVIQLAPKIAQALVAIITSGLMLIREKLPDVISTGFAVLMALLKGIDDHIVEITLKAIDIMTKFINTLLDHGQKVSDAAFNLLTSFLKGMGDHIGDVVAAGVNIIVNLILGMSNNLYRVVDMVGSIISNMVTALADQAVTLANAGTQALINFIFGIANNLVRITYVATDLATWFIKAMADNAIRFARSAADVLINFLNGLADAIREKAPQLRDAGFNIAEAIIDGMSGGMLSHAKDVATSAVDVAKGAVSKVTGFLGIHSPSRVFRNIGANMAKGLAVGLDNDTAANNSAVLMAERIVNAFQDTLSQIPDSLEGMGDLSPVITPVLDLTKVQSASKDLSSLMAVASISPSVSFDQARLISTTQEMASTGGEDSSGTAPSEVKFEQNIYSPTALSTNDIYRNTKSQIALAKEELDIA